MSFGACNKHLSNKHFTIHNFKKKLPKIAQRNSVSRTEHLNTECGKTPRKLRTHTLMDIFLFILMFMVFSRSSQYETENHVHLDASQIKTILITNHCPYITMKIKKCPCYSHLSSWFLLGKPGGYKRPFMSEQKNITQLCVRQ